MVCAILSVLVAADHLANTDEIRRGVSVGDVALGGKTLADAREILERHAPETLEKIRISGPGGDFTLRAGRLGVRFDVQATVERAYAVGRRGTLLERLGERARSVFGVSVPAEVRHRPRALRVAVEGLASRVNGEPKDASVAVSGVEVRVTGSGEGYRLDVPATAENLERALENLSGEAQMSGEVLHPEVTTDEAEAVARDAREAVSGPLVLTTAEKSWRISPAEVARRSLSPSGTELYRRASTATA